MEDKNCEILFTYLRDILYDPKVQTLDINVLDEPYQKLGMGLQYLEKAVREMKAYSAALSKGNLSVDVPERDNFLCENLKNIHANLNHLTWQAKQVAKGDYSQSVSYLGEFSEAFNTMTAQLKERELNLRKEAEREKTHAHMMEGYNQLLMELISTSEEEILVTSADGKEILYCNQKSTDVDPKTREIYGLCLNAVEKERQKKHKEGSYKWTWEAEKSDHRYYKIITAFMQWQGQQAFAHIIREVTEEKRREEELSADAHQDTLTHIGNRHLFQEKMQEILQSETQFVFCYCDLDHLKYINDRFGHKEGDWYLCHFVETVKQYIRVDDLFVRIGGDEFCIVIPDCTQETAREKFAEIFRDFSQETEHPYPKSFSIGIVDVPEHHESMQLEDIMQRADAIMYTQKRKRKAERLE